MAEGLLPVGSEAPVFVAQTTDGERVSLPDFRDRQAVLLMFYPQDDTPGCTRQMCLARDEGERYRAAGVARFGVNPGSLQSHVEFRDKYTLDFPLIVDLDAEIASAYGVLGGSEVSRATYLIGQDGRIAYAQPGTHGADEVLGRSVAEARGSGEVTVRSFTGGAFAENTYLVACARTGEGILVDPGAAAEDAIQAARAAGITIGQIVLTHAHVDHVEGIPLARRETGAPILLHPADRPLYEAAPMQAQWFGLRMEPLPPPDQDLVVGESVRFGECALAVRFAPGHAPGHVILVGDGVALVGDVIFAGSIGRTDLPGGDLAQLMKSIREQVLTLPDETTLHTGHGPDTTVGHERATNPFVTGVYGGGGFA